MKLLVLGANGFIGRHLCPRLVQSGHQVIATSRGDASDLPAAVDYRRLDLLQFDPQAFDFSGTECVIYLAARAHVLRETESDPLAAYRRLNVEAALAVASAAAARGVSRFIYLSSIGVNGLENESPFTESDPVDPQEAYAQSKWEAEQALTERCRERGMELVIIRPVLVYAGDAPGNFARLLDAVRAGRWLPLGSLRNQRSLLAVQNLAQLIEICATHDAAANQVFLAADGDDVSTPELIRQIGVAIGKPARLLPIPTWLLWLGATLFGKSREFRRVTGSLRVDINKAQTLLGWQPELSLRQALAQLKPGV